MANRIQLRRDTTANWERVNPILSDGEPSIDITTNQLKIGDGSNAWVDLSYVGSGGFTDVEGVVTFPGDFLIGTLFPNDPMPMGDKESVVWAKDDTEYLGLWWGGDMDYPNNYGPVAGIMIGPGDGSSTDDFADYPSPSNTKVVIGINGDSYTHEWTFGRDGNLTTPGEVIIESNNAHGGSGYAGLMTLTNTTVGSINSNKYVRMTSTGALEIVNSAYSTTLFSLTDAGNLEVAGSIKPNSYLPGQTINTEVLYPTDMSVTDDLISSFGVALAATYTPKSTNSYIIVEFDGYYVIDGSNTDAWYSHMTVAGTEVAYKRTVFNTDGSQNARTGVLLPLMGRYTNSNTSAKNISIGFVNDGSDDNFTLKYQSNYGFIMKITEVAR